MKNPTIIVKADWDDDAKVWVATSTDIDGLATEADTLEALRAKVLTMIAELLELNEDRSDLPEIPVQIIARQAALVPNPTLADGRLRTRGS
jgi:predicted RNase H-like HicB family nuclease